MTKRFLHRPMWVLLTGLISFFAGRVSVASRGSAEHARLKPETGEKSGSDSAERAEASFAGDAPDAVSIGMDGMQCADLCDGAEAGETFEIGEEPTLATDARGPS
jgi:hypothetical protein